MGPESAKVNVEAGVGPISRFCVGAMTRERSRKEQYGFSSLKIGGKGEVGGQRERNLGGNL